MIPFLKTYWYNLIVAVIASYGAVLSTYTFAQNRRRERRDQEKAERDECAELTRVLWETCEMKTKVAFLDEWIFEKQVFTQKQSILDALTAIRDYWKKSDEPLRRHLGSSARTYKALRGLFDIAQQNLDNQPPPNGQGVWKGITEENLLGYKVGQLFQDAETELKMKRG